MKIKSFPLAPLSFAIASLSSGLVLAEKIEQLETTEVKSRGNQTETVVDLQTLENIQATDPKSILRQVPGVTVANGLPYAQKTYIRGLEEHSANVTIDGARQDGQLFHHSGNQMVDGSMLKAVEVELGATSVLSGYGANTGSIAYSTKDVEDLLAPDDRFGMSINSGADTGTEFHSVGVSAYGKLTDQLSALAVFSKSESGDLKTPGKTIVSKHSEQDNILFKLAYQIDDTQSVKLNFQRYEDGGNRDFSGEKPGSVTLEEALGFNGLERDTYSVEYRLAGDNPALDLKVNAYINEKRLPRGADNRPFEIELMPNPQSDDDFRIVGTEAIPSRDYIYKTTGLNIRNTSTVGDVAWTYGIETFKSEQSIKAAGLTVITRTDGEPNSSRNDSVNNGPTATLKSGYVQAAFNLGAVQLVPGIRYDSYSLGGTYNRSFKKASPRFNANWQATDALDLSFGYGRIFKGPSLPETLFVSERRVETPEARAETGNHYELNLQYNLSDLTGLDDASLFANVFRFNIDGYFHPTRNNRLSSDHERVMKGYETGLRARQGSLSVFATYSFSEGEQRYATYVSDVLTAGSHRLNLGASFDLNPELSVGVQSELARANDLTERFFNDESSQMEVFPVSKKGYGVTHLWVAYKPSQIDGLSLNLAVDNLFDKAYQNHNTFGNYWGSSTYNDNEVGRNLRLSMGYKF